MKDDSIVFVVRLKPEVNKKLIEFANDTYRTKAQAVRAAICMAHDMFIDDSEKTVKLVSQ